MRLVTNRVLQIFVFGFTLIHLCGCAKGILNFNVLGCPSYSGFDGFNGGDGSPQNPYQVCSGAQLDQVRYHLTANFVQTADIDLDPAVNGKPANWFLPIVSPHADKTSDLPSQPDALFQGIYNGQQHLIQNFSFHPQDDLSKKAVGIFGVIGASGRVSNVQVAHANISGDLGVGCIAGLSMGSIQGILIQDSTITGSDPAGGCEATGDTCSGLGGLVGVNVGSIDQATVTRVNISTAGYSWVGGAVGLVVNGLTDKNNQVIFSEDSWISRVVVDSVTVALEESPIDNHGTFAGGAFGMVSSGGSNILNLDQIKVSNSSVTITPLKSGSAPSPYAIFLGGLVGFASGQHVNTPIPMQIRESSVVNTELSVGDSISLDSISVGGFAGVMASEVQITSSFVRDGKIVAVSNGTGNGFVNLSGFLGNGSITNANGFEPSYGMLFNLAAINMSLNGTSTGSNHILENGFVGGYEGSLNYTYSVGTSFFVSGTANFSAYSNSATAGNSATVSDICFDMSHGPSESPIACQLKSNINNFCEVQSGSIDLSGYAIQVDLSKLAQNPFLTPGEFGLSGINDTSPIAAAKWNFIPGQYPLPKPFIPGVD